MVSIAIALDTGKQFEIIYFIWKGDNTMGNKSRILVSGMLSLALVTSILSNVSADAEAAGKRKLSAKKITVKVGKTKKVSVKNAKGKKIKWSIKKKKIASIKKKGKYAVKVKGRKKGNTTLICKVKTGKKWKSLKCKVKVTAVNTNNDNTGAQGGKTTPSQSQTGGSGATPTGNPTDMATATPTGNPTDTVTSTPTDTVTSTPTDTVTSTPTDTATETPSATPFTPTAFLETGFENGTGDFESRGSANVSVVSGGRTGKALSVTGRTQTWAGASTDVTETVAKGATYSFSFWAKHTESGAKAIKMSAELTDANGTSYPEIAQVSCESGVWTHIEGTYTVPEEFDVLHFYFEGPDGNYDFMIDDLVITQETEGIPVIDPYTLPSLKDSYKGIFERFGNVLNYDTSWNNGTQLQDEKIMIFAQKQFNSFTLENEMKPESILSNWPGVIDVSEAKKLGYVIPDNYKESTVPQLSFDTVDRVLEKVKQYGIPMRAHVLMWHQQTSTKFFKTDYDDSKGVVSKEVMDARLEFYVKSVMKHVMEKEKSLTGKAGSLVYCWDITNEYIHRTNDPTATSWMDVYGDMGLQPTYVKKAYQAAYEMLKQYNVQNEVTLFYNDYDEYFCADDIVALVNYINSGEETNICGGIGMQSHMSVEEPSLELYGETLDKFLATGLQVHVTELDIQIDEGKDEEAQAEKYKGILSTIRDRHEKRDKTVNPRGVTCVTVWGLLDRDSWRRESSPLLFGSGINDPKPAFYSVLEAAK